MKALFGVLFMLVIGLTVSKAQDKNQVASANTNKAMDKEQTLSVGMTAPDFTLPDASGKEYKLSSYKGKSPVVVYFYPKAGTKGCTIQACGIRDDWSKFKDSNIKVLGISVDTKKQISKFMDDYHLNFPLLSDAGKNISRKYGVLKDNGLDNRVTFIVDKNGKIADIINVDDVQNHAAKVYDIASKLN